MLRMVAPRAGAWIETAMRRRVSLGHRGVAPRAGAWIETDHRVTCHGVGSGSPLAQGRGSKPASDVDALAAVRSPLAQGRGSKRSIDRLSLDDRWRVAPRAGAWIETCEPRARQRRIRSPLAQGRGSKRIARRAVSAHRVVAPRAGAWIETMIDTRINASARVAPRAGAWIETIVRSPPSANGAWSPLAQGRGSKHCRFVAAVARRDVAPRAGAWIETCAKTHLRDVNRCRPSRRGVDRNCGQLYVCARPSAGRPSRRGVDRNA